MQECPYKKFAIEMKAYRNQKLLVCNEKCLYNLQENRKLSQTNDDSPHICKVNGILEKAVLQ